MIQSGNEKTNARDGRLCKYLEMYSKEQLWRDRTKCGLIDLQDADRDDLTQTIALRGARAFYVEKNCLNSHNIKSYMFTIFRRAVFRFASDRSKEQKTKRSLDTSMMIQRSTYLQERKIELPPRIFDGLTERQLRIVEWRYWLDEPVSSIADLLHTSRDVVYKDLQRAINRMEKNLERRGF